MRGDFAHPIQAQLRDIRKARGLTLQHLSDSTAGNPSTRLLSLWELGNAVPSVKQLTRWAMALGYELVLSRASALMTPHPNHPNDPHDAPAPLPRSAGGGAP
jgi:transcriptional regulator with XRE-family HTH domain